MLRSVAYYHSVAITAHGLPYRCRCGELVAALHGPGRSFEDSGVVHHIDSDPENNDPSNLEIMHASCHISMHQLRRREDQAEVARRTWTGRRHTPEARAKISAARAGRALTPAHRDALVTAAAASNRRRRGTTYPRVECSCGRMIASNSLAWHKSRSH